MNLFIRQQYEDFPDEHWGLSFTRAMVQNAKRLFSDWSMDVACMMISL